MDDSKHFRTNAFIKLTPCRHGDKGFLLHSRLSEPPQGAELFLVHTPRAAKGTFDLLKSLRRNCRILSADQTPPEQLRTESWFATADFPALILTESAPLPTHRGDVRAVYVMNLPPSLAVAEADIHAAGGDGLLASAEFFASRRDIGLRLEEPPDGPLTEECKKLREDIEQTVAWMENDGCARVFLARHLHGKEIGVCGNCGWYLNRKSAPLPGE